MEVDWEIFCSRIVGFTTVLACTPRCFWEETAWSMCWNFLAGVLKGFRRCFHRTLGRFALPGAQCQASCVQNPSSSVLVAVVVFSVEFNHVLSKNVRHRHWRAAKRHTGCYRELGNFEPFPCLALDRLLLFASLFAAPHPVRALA